MNLDHNLTYYIEGNVITVEAYKSSPVLMQVLTPDSTVHRISKNFFVTPVSDTSFRLEEPSTEYNKVHKIGEIIKLEGFKIYHSSKIWRRRRSL